MTAGRTNHRLFAAASQLSPCYKCGSTTTYCRDPWDCRARPSRGWSEDHVRRLGLIKPADLTQPPPPAPARFITRSDCSSCSIYADECPGPREDHCPITGSSQCP